MTFTIQSYWLLWSVVLNAAALAWFFFRPKRIVKVKNRPYKLVMGRVSAMWKQSIPYETKELKDHRLTITSWDGSTYEFSIEEQYWNNCEVGKTQIWIAN